MSVEGIKGQVCLWGMRGSCEEEKEQHKNTENTAARRLVTCPPSQTAAVTCDGVAAICVAAVTVLAAVQPEGAILWGKGVMGDWLYLPSPP